MERDEVATSSSQSSVEFHTERPVLNRPFGWASLRRLAGEGVEDGMGKQDCEEGASSAARPCRL